MKSFEERLAALPSKHTEANPMAVTPLQQLAAVSASMIHVVILYFPCELLLYCIPILLQAIVLHQANMIYW